MKRDFEIVMRHEDLKTMADPEKMQSLTELYRMAGAPNPILTAFSLISRLIEDRAHRENVAPELLSPDAVEEIMDFSVRSLKAYVAKLHLDRSVGKFDPPTL